jgi:SAM-dependent methyltransferase
MSCPPAQAIEAYPIATHLDRLSALVTVEGRRIVDIGCGDGALVRALSKRGADAVGVEIDERALAPARAAPAVAAERYLEGRAEALPLDTASVDIAIFFNSLHHVPVAALDAALGEAARVLVAGGILFVLEPIAAGPYFELTRRVEDESLVRMQAYQALQRASSHGFAAMGEEVYRNPMLFKDFATFEARMIAVDPARTGVIDRHRAALCQAFEAMAETGAEGYRFHQPTRINLFRKS